MARRKVTAMMLDGTAHEATSEFMTLSDRVAFERKFGVNTAVLQKHRKLFDEGGKLKDEADIGELADAREEYHAFLSWRVLQRGGCDVGEFDEFIENCVEIDIDLKGDGVDPTDAAPQPGA